MGLTVRAIAAAILILAGFARGGDACTTFFIHHEGRSVFGKNYDWFSERGLAIVNKRGVHKTAMPEPRLDSGPYAEWTATYGSLTFNQYGREFPMGGINEAGLVIHILMLGETTYPLPDDRPAIKQLQWVQYHLDQFETVDQVIAHQAHIRILTHEKPGIHYLVADRRGDCATVEWLDGKLVVHHQESLPVRVLANNSYADSLARLKTHTGFGGDLPIHGGEASLERFVTASKMLRDFHAKPAPAMVDYAFNVLRSVRQSLFTQWSIVYDLNRLKVHFFTQQHPGIKTVALGDFDLSCTRPVQVLDMSLDAEGDVADRFTRYSEALNYRVLQEALGKSEILGEFPEAHIRRRAAHPESHLCAP